MSRNRRCSPASACVKGRTVSGASEDRPDRVDQDQRAEDRPEDLDTRYVVPTHVVHDRHSVAPLTIGRFVDCFRGGCDHDTDSAGLNGGYGSTMTEPGGELLRLAATVLQPGFVGTAPPDWVRRWLGEGLGGVALFARNVRDPEQVAALTAALRAERADVLVAHRRGGRRRHPVRVAARQLAAGQPGPRRGRRPRADRGGRPRSRPGAGRGGRQPRLRAGRRRQQQPRQPGDRRTQLRRRPGPRRPAHRRLGDRAAGRRRGRLRQALPRARRHGRRLAPRPAAHPARPGRARRRRAGCRSGPRSRPASRR